MGDVMQFKDLLGRTHQGGFAQPLQRQADPLADPLNVPIQRPVQLERAPEAPVEAEPEAVAQKGVVQQKQAAGTAAPKAAPAEEEAPEIETETVQAKLELGGDGGGPAPADDPIEPVVQQKPATPIAQAAAPAKAAPAEEEAPEVESEAVQAKLELGGGDPGPSDDPIGGDDGGGDPIQAKGGGDSALPGGGDAPAAPETPSDAPAPSPAGAGAAAPGAPAAPSPSAPAASPSGGGPIPEGVRGGMEKSLGGDFKDVSVREDASASALGAQAYTQGKDITFAPGKLDTGSKEGQKLLGHELKHTQQQAAGQVEATHQAKGGQAINADPALEAEADAAGEKAAAGLSATGTSAASGGAQAKASGSAPVKADAPIQAKAEGVIQFEDKPSDATKKSAAVTEPVDWSKEAGVFGADYKGFVEFVAAKTGDAVATQKVKEAQAETDSKAAEKVPLFYEQTTAKWLAAPPADRAKPSALYGVMQNVAWPWKGLGKVQALEGSQKELHRAIGIGMVYGVYVPNDDKVKFLEKERARLGVPNDKILPFSGSPTRSGKLDLANNWDDITYVRWLEHVRDNATTAIEPSRLTGTLDAAGWWTPDLKTKLEATPEKVPDADFGVICNVLSLAPEWYPDGFVEVSMEFGKTDWVRPTVFDGMMSPLWKQHPASAMPKAGGGAVEVLGKKAMPANQLTRAVGRPVTAELSAQLRAEQDRQKTEGTNTNAWVYDTDKSGNGKVGELQTTVMTEMNGSPDAGLSKDMADWDKSISNYENTYWEGEKFDALDGKVGMVEAFVLMDLQIGNYRKKDSNKVGDGTPVPKGSADRIAALVEKKAKNAFMAQSAEGGFQKAALNARDWAENQATLMNVELFADKIHISSINLYLSQDAKRANLREERDKMNLYIHDGKRSAETDRYWVKEGKKPPGVSEEEWVKMQQAHGKTAVAETPVVADAEATKPEPTEKKPKHPEATSIKFVSEKFEVKDTKAAAKADRKKAVPLVVTGDVWLKPKGAEANASVPADASIKVRRAVAQTFPDLVANRVSTIGLGAAIDAKEVDKISQVAAITAGYDAERFDLEILEVHATVLRDEAAEAAFKTAAENGEIDAKEDPKIEASLEITEDEINGKVNIPIMQLGGGMVARNLNGAAKWDRKGKVIKQFSGGATVIIPIGSSQVLEVTVADAVISRNRGGGYDVESGTGSFACKMPVYLFEKNGWKWYLAAGAKGSVTVKNNDIDDISGDIDLRVSNPEGVDVFHIKANTSFAINKKGEVKKPLSGQVDAEVLADLELGKGFGPDKTWTAFLSKGTHAGATVSKGVLTKINGTLKAHVNDGDKTWLTLEANGDYDHAKRVANIPIAKLEVIESTLVGRIGEGRDILFVKGSKAEAVLESNEVKKVSGELDFIVKEGGTPKIGGKINGSWEPAKGLDGKGTFTLLDHFTSDVPGGTIKIYKGSNGGGEMVAGKIQSINGSVEADYVSVFREQPLVMHFKGKAHYDWPSKTLVSAEAYANLVKPLKLHEKVKLDTLEGSIWMANNQIVKAQGKLGASFLNEKGVLAKGVVEGKWVAEGNQIDGSAKVTLEQDLDLNFGKRLAAKVYKGASVKATVAAGELTEIKGAIKADLLQDGKSIASLAAEGTYDVKNNVLVYLKATAELTTQIKLLGDKLTIDGAKGSLVIENNRLTSLSGSADITAPVIKVTKANFTFSWRNDGEKDYYAFTGKVDWVFFEEKERFLKGNLDIDYKEDGTFLATAVVKYRMSKGFDAEGKLSVDNTLLPTVEGLHFGIKTTLAEADPELFKFDKTLIKLFIPIIGILQLRLGVNLGVQLGMKALQAVGSFDLDQPWKLDENTQVPEFTANLKLPWGLNLSLYLGAMLEAALSVFIASAGIGAEVGLRLNVPMDITPSLTLVGSKKGWSGAFGLALSIKPELLLEILAYVFADVIFFDPMEGELGKWSISLAKFEGIEWSDEIRFGDQPEQAKGKAKKEPVKPPVPKGTPDKKPKPAPVNKKPEQLTPPEEVNSEKSKKIPLPGGGAIDGGGPLDSQKKGAKDESDSGKGEMEERMKNVEDVMEGLKSIDVFVDFVMRIGASILKAGLMAPVLLAWEWLNGTFKLDELKAAWAKFTKGIKAAGRLLKGFASPLSFTYRLGKWMNGEISASEVIFGADDDAMKMYKDGMHKGENADYKVHGAMLNALCGTLNVSQEEEEVAIVEILKAAEKKGHLAAAVNMIETIEYDGTDQVLYHLDYEEDETARKIFDRNGMPYGGTVQAGHSNYEGNVQADQVEVIEKKIAEGPEKYREGLEDVYKKQGLKSAWTWAHARGLVPSDTQFRADRLKKRTEMFGLK